MRHVELHEHSEETARGTVLLAGWAPAHLNPEVAAEEARAIPRLAPYVAERFQDMTGHAITQDSIELFGHTIIDTHKALEKVGFGGTTLAERLAFATDPESIVALSSLAYRSESAKAAAIADYPGGHTIIERSDDGGHLALHEYFGAAAQSGRHCPYARDFSHPEKVHKLFKSSELWIARAAVYIEELYRK